MNKDNEPIFTDFNLSIDEPPRTAPTEATNAKLDRPLANRGSNTNKAFMAAIILLALGLIYITLKFEKAQNQLVKHTSTLKVQAENLALLNERLSVTGENANLSTDALKVVIKEQDSEIRKLWDVANKRNRHNIEQNTQAITVLNNTLKKQHDEHSKKLHTFEQEAQQLHKQQTATLATQTKEFQHLQQQVQAFELRASQQQEMLENKNKQLTQLQKNLTHAQNQIKALQAELAVIGASNK